MIPYFEDPRHGIRIFLGDARVLIPQVFRDAPEVVLVMDPPYGIAYESARERRVGSSRSIQGDEDTSCRDEVLARARAARGDDVPALVFGSWRRPRPEGTRAVLIWDKGGALGMGDLTIPWKADHEEIYVLGRGFVGRRDSGSVLRCAPEQSMGRLHPHQKPVRLLTGLLAKTVGLVVDPFCGVGSTLVAAKELGRPAIGIEVDERYCEQAVRRLGQEVMRFPGMDRA